MLKNAILDAKICEEFAEISNLAKFGKNLTKLTNIQGGLGVHARLRLPAGHLRGPAEAAAAREGGQVCRYGQVAATQPWVQLLTVIGVTQDGILGHRGEERTGVVVD